MAKKDYKSPFKGVVTYEERDSELFFGRNDETIELVDKIISNNLTLIYGRSGIGKSSLLNAGVIPLLKRMKFNNKHFLPVRIVLNTVSTDSYESQIIKQFIKLSGITHSEQQFAAIQQYLSFSADNYIPVFIIDQFEEVYYQDEFERNVSKRNNLLRSLNKLLSETPSFMDLFRIVISFREDYLCNIEDDTYLMPQLYQNRYRLLPLTLENGGFIIRSILTSHNLVDGDADDICNYIICKLFSNSGKEWTVEEHKNDKIDVMEMSLYCMMIDELRNGKNERYLTKQLIDEKTPTEVLTQYYRDSTNGIKKTCIEFVEENLLDKGHKKRAKINNLGKKVIEGLRYLEDKGILRYYEGNCEYEIAHDKICLVIQREKELRLKQREVWTDYFVLFPFYLFVGVASYFLLNAIMNELSLVLFARSNNYIEEMKAYDGIKAYNIIKDFLKYPIVHLLGNAILLIMSFCIPNFVVLYIKQHFHYRFTMYGLSFVVASIILCIWHYTYYIPYHTIFKNENTDFSIVVWWIIYGGFIIIPFVILSLSLINNSHFKKEKWSNILFGKELFSLQSAKIYTIVVLFICLFLCNVPIYTRVLSSGESIIFVFLIGYVTHSIFDNNVGVCKYFIWHILFYLGLFLYDGEIITNKLVSKWPMFENWPFNNSLYLLLLFFIFIIVEIVLSKKSVAVLSQKKVICGNVLIVFLATILYLGHIPFVQSPSSPICKNIVKWHFLVNRENDCYGAVTASNKLLIPYIFDSVNDNSASLSFCFHKNILLQNSIDSLFFVDGSNLKPFIESKNDSLYVWNCLFNLDYVLLHDIDMNDSIHKYAYNAYCEFRDGLSYKLKYGKPMLRENLDNAIMLQKMTRRNVDSLYMQLSKKKGCDITLEDFLKYLESVIQEMSIVFSIEAFETNSIFFTLTAHKLLLTNAFFHNTMSTNASASIMNINMHVNHIAQNVSNTDSILSDFSINESISLHNKELSAYKYTAWRSLWKLLNTEIKTYLLFHWMKDLETQSMRNKSAIPQAMNLLNKAKNIVNSQKKITGIQNMSTAANMLDSLNVLLKLMANHKDIKKRIDNLNNDARNYGEFIVKLKSSRKKHATLWDCCNNRLSQIQNLTKDGFFKSFGKEYIRDLIPLLIMSESSSESKSFLKMVKDMEKEDSVLNSKEYGELLKQIELEQELMRLGNQLRSQ